MQSRVIFYALLVVLIVLQVIYAKPDISGDIPGADKSIGGQIVGNVVNPRGNGCNGPLDRNEAVCVKHCTDIGPVKSCRPESDGILVLTITR
ncbi:unnamed protein product [Oppiella nova]|uniref:Uncharacterized protein n=1 Tax=Oppiella nova TaxID=334625 RepID=A0A7R9M087_9ACAR|nr:unnamed protein product [Oppiella nova]CAG2168656.1 unnamed protein product [Oppiella nova]